MKRKIIVLALLLFVFVAIYLLVDPLAMIPFPPVCGEKQGRISYESLEDNSLLSVKYPGLSEVFKKNGYKLYFPDTYTPGKKSVTRWMDKKEWRIFSSPKTEVELTEASDWANFDEAEEWRPGEITYSELSIWVEGGTGIDDWLAYRDVVKTINRNFHIELPAYSYVEFRSYYLNRDCS